MPRVWLAELGYYREYLSPATHWMLVMFCALAGCIALDLAARGRAGRVDLRRGALRGAARPRRRVRPRAAPAAVGPRGRGRPPLWPPDRGRRAGARPGHAGPRPPRPAR